MRAGQTKGVTARSRIASITCLAVPDDEGVRGEHGEHNFVPVAHHRVYLALLAGVEDPRPSYGEKHDLRVDVPSALRFPSCFVHVLRHDAAGLTSKHSLTST